mgnify:CR=1 FL=1
MKKIFGGIKGIPKNRIVMLVFLDVLTVIIASFLALYIRYDFSFRMIPTYYMEYVATYAVINIPLTLLIYLVFRLYQSVWAYASASELLEVGGASIVSTAEQMIGMQLLDIQMPRSYHVIYMMMLIVGTTGIRFGYRLLRVIREKVYGGERDRINTMLIGAGAAGNTILKEIEGSEYLRIKVCCIIDDNRVKQGKYLRGIQIVGGRHDIEAAVEQYDISEIIVALPSAEPEDLSDILNICKETGCKIRRLPGLYQLVNGEVSISKLREVRIEDLLGREPIRVNMHEITGYLKDKVVLVTGGGGSIGSELCRQIAKAEPKQLVIVDIYENNAYDIQQELVREYPDLDLQVLIGSVRSNHRLDEVFGMYHPEIVYHAAAHKHVPLMEVSPKEAIKNNVFGTYKTAETAIRHGVKRFVLISTDKAVNPTSIMGASKRMCEMVIQMMNQRSSTEFVAVRFGNVLGSNGSVIPLFERQIAQGGPVTVTHPDIVRYFMTIPEAVSLVLQAGSYAKGGEIFVLDMGKPVKILDMAENLIKLSGYKPGVDIKIEFTGLRPGEKLYEELLMDEEGLKETDNHRIYIGHPIMFDEDWFEEKLRQLATDINGDIDIRKRVKEIVPTYQPKEAEKQL